MQILHIDTSIFGDASVSRTLSAAIAAELRDRYPDAGYVYRDLAAQPVAHMDAVIAAGFRPSGIEHFSAADKAEHALSETLVTELLTSDVIVLGVPMYNFSVPSQLKAWFDRLAQPGRTFQYTAAGPVGIAGDQQVIMASTRGGGYTSGPAAAMDFHETYTRAYFGFLGIKRFNILRAELLSKGPELRSQSIRAALDGVPDVVAALTAQGAV
ncbi:FMN-dependent NADH-azoreductase [Duganella sp. FT50W]|uniref:FMN dependent NADH:quinone oxidoreductase n=1 Tax=Duganella lactea TaxID=2692173 RepID=A0A6L8ME85_9BURK|nr:NAD(P)H-dependent oxidoreductase [Duganella lactea]MYM80461.1 FMN-dependent NADH-azoreductase [Duganella lactea]